MSIRLTNALVALALYKIPTDVQELLLRGDPARKIPPGALAAAIECSGCERCGDDDISPNVEAFELSGEIVCDDCAEEIFEENSQFGMGQ
jgi:hypothetical protein